MKELFTLLFYWCVLPLPSLPPNSSDTLLSLPNQPRFYFQILNTFLNKPMELPSDKAAGLHFASSHGGPAESKQRNKGPCFVQQWRARQNVLNFCQILKHMPGLSPRLLSAASRVSPRNCLCPWRLQDRNLSCREFPPSCYKIRALKSSRLTLWRLKSNHSCSTPTEKPLFISCCSVCFSSSDLQQDTV